MSGAKIITRLENLRGKAGFFACAALGALAVLGHAPLFIWPAFLICLSLFWVHLDALVFNADRPGRAAFWAGWAIGFGYFLAGLYWIASAFLTRGGGYIWLTPLGVLLMPAGLAFFWAFAALLYAKIARRFRRALFIRALIFALILFGFEWLRGHVLSGFPWNLPGYIWAAGGAVSQNAAYMGIYGVSLITLIMAACMGPVWRAGLGKLNRFGPVFIGAVLLIFCASYGNYRLDNANVTYVAGTNIRVIQAKIDQLDKFAPGGYSQTIDTYLDLSLQPSGAPLTHIIWSEGAIPGLVLEDAGLMRAINTLFKGGPDLMLGATRRVPDDSKPGGYRYHNSLAALRASPGELPEILGTYDKSKLVPFGEYFPANAFIEGLNIPALTRATSSFDKGLPGLTDLPGLPPISVQICYESIFAGFTPSGETPAQNPQWILNISNDSWFGKSSGPHQHFNQVRYRAIEEGLPVVRAAASGFSGFVDPWGRVIKTLPLDASGPIDSPLPKPL